MFSRTYHINIYFGKTGGGKTVSAVCLMYKLHRENRKREKYNVRVRKVNDRRTAKAERKSLGLKRFRLRLLPKSYAPPRLKREKPLLNIYTNIDTSFPTIKVTKNDLKDGALNNGALFLDEGSLMFNNRKFKTFTDENQEFFRYHRKRKLNVYVFSQSNDDTDKVIRTLAHNEFIVRKFMRFWIAVVPVKMWVGVDELTKDYVTKREMRWMLAAKYYFWPRWSFYFDTTQRLE
jgi:hypothetical protein